MSDQDKLEKVIKGLECCTRYPNEYGDCLGGDCPYGPRIDCHKELTRDALALLKSLSAFKEYFDGLYGEGLGVANYHLNGTTEPFDNFYDSAMEEYENARCD